MKKLILLFTVLLYITSAAFAQKTKVQTAYNYYNYDELDKAKTNIDEAATFESTMGMAKTWYYRGEIYQKMYKHPKFGDLDPDCLQKALDSYNKALEIEPKYEFSAEINQNKQVIINQIFGEGVENFNAKKFDISLKNFETVIKNSPNDTLSILNAAYSAEKAGNKAKAYEYYNKLISMKYKDAKIYLYLSKLYKEDGDTTKALTTIQNGRLAFPADNSLVIEELNMYLFAGKDKEAQELLNVAIQGDPGNSSLYFAQGTVFDKLNMKTDAANSYKKAIDLNPDYFDAYYNLGAMYFNDGAEMANKANDLKSNTEYAKAKEAFEAKFKEAEPFLEKALSINPKDTNTMVSLKQLYARLNETDKYDKIKSQLEGK